MKRITLTISEARALLILNEFLQNEHVEGSHRFNDHLPLIETGIASLTQKWMDAPTNYDPLVTRYTA
jgi:hypothetical protein